MLQAVPDAAARGVVDAPEDVLERMRDQAARIGAATLTRYAEVVHAGLGEMRGATAPRLLLEVVCARLLLPSASDTESALLQRVERIETRLDMSIPADSATAAVARAHSGETVEAVRPQDQGRPRRHRQRPQPEPAPVRRPNRSTPEARRAATCRHRRRCSRPADPVVAAPAAPAVAAVGEPDAAAVRSSGRRCARRCVSAAARSR